MSTERGDLARRAVVVGTLLATVILVVVGLVAVVSAHHDGVAFFGPVLAKKHRSHGSSHSHDSGSDSSDGSDGSNSSDSSESADSALGVPVWIPCATVVTDASSLTSVLAVAAPNVVICVRGRSSSGSGRDFASTSASRGPRKQLKIWLTGYSWQDNTPPGSSTVSHPILHKQAGGTGTYRDPITVAVPGKGSGIWKAGSKFYLPTVKRYVIVEDTGASKPPSGQDGHLDMWIGGKGGSRSATDACMDKITDTGVPAELNPPPNLPVIAGPIYSDGGCNIPKKS